MTLSEPPFSSTNFLSLTCSPRALPGAVHTIFPPSCGSSCWPSSCLYMQFTLRQGLNLQAVSACVKWQSGRVQLAPLRHMGIAGL